MNIPLRCPRTRLRTWSRETGSVVPSRVSLLILHTQAESDAYSRDSSRFPRRCPFMYLNRHTPSGQSRVCRVTHLRTDGVHCRESVGTGPVVLEVVPVTNAYSHFAGRHRPFSVRLSFPTPTIVEEGGAPQFRGVRVRRSARRVGRSVRGHRSHRGPRGHKSHRSARGHKSHRSVGCTVRPSAGVGGYAPVHYKPVQLKLTLNIEQ